MYRILEGVLRSAHPPEIKHLIFKKIEASGNHSHQSDEVVRVLTICLEQWLRKGNNHTLVKAAKGVFDAWSQSNKTIAHDVVYQMLNEDCAANFHIWLNEIDVGELSELLMMLYTLTPSEQSKLTPWLKSEGIRLLYQSVETVKDLAKLTELLIQCPDYFPENISSFLSDILRKLANFTTPQQIDEVKDFIHNCSSVAKLVRLVWQSAGTSQKACILFSLQVLFNIIVRDRASHVSAGLSTVLQSVPQVMIADVCNNLINDTQVSDDQISLALSRMIEWLSWPKHQTIHLWINRIAKELVKAGKQIILFEVTEDAIPNIIPKLQYPQIQSSTLQVMQTLLLLHQHCAQIFLKCVPDMIVAIDWLHTDELKTDLSNTLQVLMYLHPGHPEVYNKIYSRIADFPVLSEVQMQEVIDRFNVSPVSSGNHHYSTSILASIRAQGSLVGLENLGNTCFANSVIQALYNIDSFREFLLQSELSSLEYTRQLQIIFSLLKLSQRSVIKPSDFIKKVFPSWFQFGSQQDSSEYLRYLLDGIHEQFELKKDKIASSDSLSFPEDCSHQFTGEWTTTVKCHSCGNESQNKEKFYDISLHFNTDEATPAAQNQAALLTDMLQHAFNPEEMSGENQFFCDKCGKLQDATKSISELYPPESLLLTLFRFSYNHKLGKRNKIKTVVSFPEVLEFNDCTYHINAVIVHSGNSLDGGHYYTYARSLLQESWYLFNDDTVTPCHSPTALNQSGGSRLSSDTPYILMYSKKPHIIDQAQAVSLSLQSLVTRDNLLAARQWKAESEKRQKYKSACRPSQAWYSNEDKDTDEDPPHADKSLDLSGSRFIF